MTGRAGRADARHKATATAKPKATDGGTTPQKYEEKFVARVAELTGGRFRITLFAAGQIAGHLLAAFLQEK